MYILCVIILIYTPDIRWAAGYIYIYIIFYNSINNIIHIAAKCIKFNNTIYIIINI